MKPYGGLGRDAVLQIYSFVMQTRSEKGLGQRNLQILVREHFGAKISENTIAGWIFRGIVPFAHEKTQFKKKPKPPKEALYEPYVTQKQSAETLGKKYTVSTSIMINWLRSYNIPTRTHLEAMNTDVIRNTLRKKKLRKPTKNYIQLTPEKAYILGVLCGDGHINPKTIRFEIRKDEEFIKEFSRCLKKIYGLHFNYNYYKPRNSFVLYASSKIVCGDLLQYSLFGVKNWRVPKKILFSKDKKIIGSFLRGFYDSEGCVSKSSIVSASVCKAGLEDVQTLLKKLDIKSTLRPADNERYYVIYIFRKQRFKRFKERVGFTIARKNSRIDAILANGIFYKPA